MGSNLNSYTFFAGNRRNLGEGKKRQDFRFDPFPGGL
jgi:hypothetical protein